MLLTNAFCGSTLYLFTGTRSNEGQICAISNKLKKQGSCQTGETIHLLPLSLWTSWQIWASGCCHNKSLGTCRGGPHVGTCGKASWEQEAFQIAGWCHNGQKLTASWKSEWKTYRNYSYSRPWEGITLAFYKLLRTDNCKDTYPHFGHILKPQKTLMDPIISLKLTLKFH